MTRNKEQFRAVVLAALMVMSVFAGTIAFTGTAAADASAIDLGAGDGNSVSVEAGSSATIDSASVSDSDGTPEQFTLWVDVNGDGFLNDSEPNETVNNGAPASFTDFDVSSLSTGTYNVSAAETTNAPSSSIEANETVEDQLTVTKAAAPVLQSAVHFDNSTNNTAEVELAFDENVTVQTLNVSKVDGNTNLVTGFEVDNGRVVATLGQAYTEDLEVTYKVTDESGNTYAKNKTADVEFAAVTTNVGDSDDAYKGSTVAVVSNNTSTDVEITGTADDNSFFRSGSTGDNSKVYVFDTENRDVGEYEVVFDGDEMQNATIEIRELGLSVSVDDLTVTNDDDSTIEGTVSANAGDRPVTVELVDADDDTVETIGATLTGQAEYDYTFNASDLDAGNYTVVATDNQSGVTAESSSIVVEKAGTGQADFAEGIVTEERGDIANITVELQNTDTATLKIGSSDVGFVSNVTVVDDDGDGMVNVSFNTYAASGLSGSLSDTQAETLYSVGEDDEIDSAEIDSDNSVDALLDAGEYDLEVQTGTDSDSDDAQGVGTLVLEERNTSSLQSWTAPSNAEIENKGDVYAAINNGNITQDDEIAFGDLSVHQLEASGLAGALDAQDADNTTAAFFALNGSAYSLTVEQTEAGANRDPFMLELGNSSATVISDAENDTYFVVFDSDEVNTTGRDLADDDGLTANFTVSDDSPIGTDEEQSVEDSYELVEAEHTLDDVTVAAAADQTVAGESNVAPGTEINLRVRSDGDTQPSFLKTATAYVTENGTYEAAFDFSEQNANDTFTVTVRGGVADSITADGTVSAADNDSETSTEVSETVTATEAPEETATATEEPADTATATEEPEETATATEAPADSETETETSTPGFGAVVAVTALLAAALLAVRRD